MPFFYYFASSWLTNYAPRQIQELTWMSIGADGIKNRGQKPSLPLRRQASGGLKMISDRQTNVWFVRVDAHAGWDQLQKH